MHYYEHLNLLERERLFGYKEAGISLREIAKRLKRNVSTISRELDRNTKYGNKYIPCLAENRAIRVGLNQRYQAPLKNPEIFLYVREHLRAPFYWTPQMISGHIKYDIKKASIDTETIYRYIYSKKARIYAFWKLLPCGRHKRMKKQGRKVHNKGKIPNAVSIDLRPKSIDKRKELGHWETDNIEGSKGSKPALSVTLERTARLVLITKLPNQTAVEKTKALTERLKPLHEKLRISITSDNGSENYGHEKTSQSLEVAMYFCHAYHSWEKGAVENRNKVIRRFFPKGTDFTGVSEKAIQNVEQIVNSMPMKCLDYLTPYEKIQKLENKLRST